MSRDFFKDVVVLSSLGAYVEPYGLATFPQWKPTADMAYSTSPTGNLRTWGFGALFFQLAYGILRYHAILASGNVYAAVDPLYPFIFQMMSSALYDGQVGFIGYVLHNGRLTSKQRLHAHHEFLDITSEARDDTTRDVHWRV